MTSKKITLEFSNCIDCPHHSVIRDPDPYDSFCSDDVAVVCTKTKRKGRKPSSRYLADQSPYKLITTSCRPYNTRKECPIPKWCPL